MSAEGVRDRLAKLLPGVVIYAFPITIHMLSDEAAALADRLERGAEAEHKIHGYATELSDVERILGLALGYAPYPEDGPGTPGDPAVGDHTAATLAAEIARRLADVGASDPWEFCADHRLTLDGTEGSDRDAADAKAMLDEVAAEHARTWQRPGGFRG